jgi:hypothetical protein
MTPFTLDVGFVYIYTTPAARMQIMAMTTDSSIRVNPFDRFSAFDNALITDVLHTPAPPSFFHGLWITGDNRTNNWLNRLISIKIIDRCNASFSWCFKIGHRTIQGCHKIKMAVRCDLKVIFNDADYLSLHA